MLAALDVMVRAARDAPIVRLEDPDIELHAKLDYSGPIGSIKDRPALWILRSAIERGEIEPGTTVVESSSGNFGIAIAALCRLLGLRFIPVIDPNISPQNEAVLRSLCDDVVKVTERDETGGFLLTRLARVRELCAALPRAYWPNQYANRDGMLGHYHLTAGEICRCMTDLDLVFIGVSSGGTISGVSQRLKERFPGVRVVAVDAEGSVIFGGPPKKRRIPGIGASVVPELVAHAIIDDVVIVPEIEAAAACRELLERHRLFVGGSSGSAYAAVKRYAPRARGGRRPRALFLCADRGTAYVDTVFNDAWVSRLREVS
ncbi:MAG: 2,3-diaminopropionate biosynthesis protein SbnA [Polyangiaceae bacterium]|nr:2,3-diaminopropionate biosynthesis protein SbnA [Polyangiaceae bacterium]